MPYKRGAPGGNTNRLKHGRYRADAVAQRKLVRETICSARLALMQAQLEMLRPNRAGKPRMDEST
ncbi:MAG TPA: hypothetical protein VHU18_09580 [Rhizomicrobium sp.]|jgi:hypothetical protein|nr:hypothetical protein [Rhizomicrobium sp.]